MVAKQTLDEAGVDQLSIGTTANDGTGTQGRTAMSYLKNWAIKLNAMLSELYAPTFYAPASLTVTTGTLSSGTVTSAQTLGDGTNVDVTEVTGVPGFDVRFGFTGITTTPLDLLVRCQYNPGGSNHDVEIEIYNYNTTTWVTLCNVPTNSNGYSFFNIGIPNWTNYVSGGAAQVRFYHYTTGTGTHHLLVDYIGLEAA